MEPLKQFAKIGAGLAALIAIGLLAIPERPTLLAERAAPRAEAPPEAAPAPAVEAVAGEGEPLAAASPSSPPDEAAAPVEAPPAPVAEAQLTPGQLHLQRLRGGSPASAVPDETPPAEEPAASDEMPPDDADVALDQGGGAGLDSLTRPTAPVQFRLLSAPSAADSGTIAAGDQSVRLAGLVPVPAEARCADGTSCGAEAREAVQSWLAGRALLCAISPEAGDSTEAPCLMGEEDVGEWIVGNGWAEAAPGSRYVEAQERARAAGRGIWAAGGR